MDRMSYVSKKNEVDVAYVHVCVIHVVALVSEIYFITGAKYMNSVGYKMITIITI